MIEEIKKVNKLVATYKRVSTSNQENEGTIETQNLAIKEFAQKNGYTIVQEYEDNGWSGDSLARPGLDQLRMDAKKKSWEAVLMYDPDRLARRGSWQEVVMEELKELEIDVLFVTIPQAKTDEDIIMYKMRGVFTEYERMKIKERFRLGKVRKAKEGHVVSSQAPYGYTLLIKKGKRGDSDFAQGHYEVNEEEAETVKKLFSWVDDEGLTLRALVRKLQELEIKPRKSERGVWSTSTLSTLLRNRTYIGEAHYGASYAVVPQKPLKQETYKKIKKTSRKMKPESEWIKIPVPKIIDEDVFNRVGQKLKSSFILSRRNTKNEYLLAGQIWCVCGQRRAGEGPQKGKHLYYRCSGRVNSFPLPSLCNEKGLNARIVDKMVWQEIIQLISSPERLLEQAEVWLNLKNQTILGPTINIQETEREISKLKNQEDRYAKAYGAGAITLDQFKEYTIPIRDKISFLNVQISEITEDRKKEGGVVPKLGDIEAFAQNAPEELKNLSFDEKKEIVRGIIDKAVGTREKLQVYGFVPIISNINVCTSYRYCRIAECGEVHAF
ncbi:MAG: recombinase family protein [Candidatus Pacebacteria bacterium]|nr:recombinase family protein [Candidatus Paceibacterota bacterium]